MDQMIGRMLDNRYEILESPLHEDAKEPCAPREKEV